MKSPLLSIIIPAYNAERYLTKAIQSIINQTFHDWELWICDDGSTDGSWDLITSYEGVDERIHFIKNSKNKGKVKTVNALVEKCKGKYLTVHDADDWSEKHRLKAQMLFLEKNKDYIGCGTQFHIYRNKNIFKSTLETDFKAIKKGLSVHSQIHGPTLVFRATALNETNKIYREYFEGYNEDYDLCIRLSHLGKLKNIDEYYYNYRSLPTSLSKKHDIKRMCLSEIMPYLISQRNEYGYDDIDKGDFSFIQEVINRKQKLYETDKSMPEREQTEILFHNGFYKAALINSCKTIFKQPLKIRNYRLLQYIIRKLVFRF